MTIFARDPNTGMASWAYQMTPHDEWDYDGVNEMILADISVRGQRATKALVHFDRNGFAYTLDRETVRCWSPRSTIRRSTGRRRSTCRPAVRRS